MNEFFESLSEPDSLKFVVPALVGIAIAILSFVSGFVGSLISPMVAKKTESKKIRTTKGLAILEDVAAQLQKVEGQHKYFEEFWKQNYGHHDNFGSNIKNFNSKESLFHHEYSLIRELRANVSELENKLLGKWIYLSPKALAAIDSYIPFCPTLFTPTILDLSMICMSLSSRTSSTKSARKNEERNTK